MLTRQQIEQAIRTTLAGKTAAVSNLFKDPENVRQCNCSVEGCNRRAYAGGLCNAHYIRKRAGKPLSPPVRARKRDDLCAECGGKTGAKGGWGLCAPHYKYARYRLIKGAAVSAFGSKCSKCHQSFPLSVYDFHHLADKEDSPSSMFINASVSRLAMELSKCVMLCANCHRVEHSESLRSSNGVHS